ncbi:hypothetical protein [Pseudoalteromonas sp. JC3]|uniref:hypothetical protein n=1 Tax=Pseudoalteromonas sp. JC3 TaxID=2810196 RepID=UPI00257109FB|nr:hypothetical protein [Pseudoalteromonas sp. JC3]WJE09884.1 hypothetical protein QSH61_05330 [Pseudoalteromonas sp. JC3]
MTPTTICIKARKASDTHYDSSASEQEKQVTPTTIHQQAKKQVTPTTKNKGHPLLFASKTENKKE